MRNRLLHYTYVLLYCLLISTTVHSQLQKLYVNPKAPGTEKQSQIVDSIRFIPLEQKAEITLGQYSGVELTDKYFLIRDYSGKAIILYKKNGDFVKRIDYKKLGENFYPSYQQHNNQLVFFGTNKSYALTAKDRIKISLDWNNPRNKKYFKKYIIDLNDTTFTIKPAVVEENDIISANHYDNNFYWQGKITTSPLYKDSVDYELKIYRNNQMVKGFFPYNRINEARFLYSEESTQLSKTETPDTYLLTRPYCDTIYKMINDSLFPAYHLVLPLENTLPASFFTTPFKNKTERENFGRNNGWMLHQVHDFYETPRFVFFTIGYLSNYDSYVYRKQDKSTFKSKNIKSDPGQYNLQLMADFGTERQGDKFYKTQKAGDLLLFFEQNKDVPVPGELEQFLKSKPLSATPVIVEFKLKK